MKLNSPMPTRSGKFTCIDIGKIRIHRRDEAGFELMSRRFGGMTIALREAVRFYLEHNMENLKAQLKREDDFRADDF